jgi:hypothetical protein
MWSESLPLDAYTFRIAVFLVNCTLHHYATFYVCIFILCFYGNSLCLQSTLPVINIFTLAYNESWLCLVFLYFYFQLLSLYLKWVSGKQNIIAFAFLSTLTHCAF